jgi:molecular chaperone DnaK
MNKDTIIGIDLGTTNSCVAVMENGQVKVIENAEGMRTTPSVVGYGPKGDVLVGITAKRQAITNPTRTISAVKRLIGRRFQDKDVQQDIMKKASFQIVESKNGDAWVAIGDKQYAPEQISAEILRKMKQTAESYLGYQVTKAVITVPAYFNDSQRQATKDAGQIAGLSVERIINEPTAAALAYGIDNKKENQVVAVYDLGGGTFDISIIEINHMEGSNQIEVLATNGNTFLGGEDFDAILMDHIINSWKNETGIDLHNDVLAMQRIREAAEKGKVELSSTIHTRISLPFITADASGAKHIDMEITRSKFESLVSGLIEKTLEPCRKALEDSKMSKSDLTDIILIGGQTRMPKVKEAVAAFFGKTARQDTNPDEAVAIGAAIQGGVLSGNVKELLLLDVTPLSLGIETQGGIFTVLIQRNTTVPTKKSNVFSTAENNQPEVQINVLQGESKLVQNNKMLGTFNLQDIAPAPRGEPKIEVSFDVDANGILIVSAKDQNTSNAKNITITAAGGLSEAEIENMINNAKQNEAAETKIFELIETKNKADRIVYSVEKLISEHKDLDATDKSSLEAASHKLTSLIKEKDVEKSAIEAEIKVLEQLFYPISQKAYEKGQKPAEPVVEDAETSEPVIEDAEVVA